MIKIICKSLRVDFSFKSYVAFSYWLYQQVACCNDEHVCHVEECSRLCVSVVGLPLCEPPVLLVLWKHFLLFCLFV